jgi:dihydrofolate reductase
MEKNLIRAILAHDSQWGVGKDGDLPWPKNSEDMKWFKQCTTGNTVIMGRKTWDSLPKKPLPNRLNAVVTSRDLESNECIIADMEGMLKLVPFMKNSETYFKDIWVIGGPQLVKTMIPYIDEMWLNNVGGDYECDTFLDQTVITELFAPFDVEEKTHSTITKWRKK